VSPDFRTDGNTRPRSDDWNRLAAKGCADYRLVVDGLVETPQSFSLAELRAMPPRTQITRHDCVEGWRGGSWEDVGSHDWYAGI
jgi:DMSO/TMAO reductase YedYZ molybdopterin-dependent catalytic subunit